MRERDLGDGELAKGPQAGAEPVPWGLGEGPRPGCGDSVKTALKFCLGAVFVLVTKKLMLEAENEDGGGARGGTEQAALVLDILGPKTVEQKCVYDMVRHTVGQLAGVQS